MAVSNAQLSKLGQARGQIAPYSLVYDASQTSLGTDFEMTAAGSYINGSTLVGTYRGPYEYNLVGGPGSKITALYYIVSSVNHCTWSIISGDASFHSEPSAELCQINIGGGTSPITLRAAWSDGFNIDFYVEINITVTSDSSSFP